MNAIAKTLAVDVVASPFRETETWFVPVGANCAWLVENAPDLVTRDPVHVVVLIGGEPCPSEVWRWVKPKPDVSVAIVVVPKDDDAFQFATTALQITSAFVGFVNPLAGVGLAVGGGLLLEAFRPKPKRGGVTSQDGAIVEDTSAGVSINQLRPDQQIPAVPGEHSVSLPLLAPPYIDIVGDKEVVFMLAGLQGAHELEDKELNEVEIAEFADSVTFAEDNGLSGLPPNLTIYDKIVIQEEINQEFELWDTLADPSAALFGPYNELIDQSNPTTSRPRKHFASSGIGPDEIWLHFLMPNGFSTDTSDRVGTAFTIELRRRGTTTWRKLPYIRMTTREGIDRQFRFSIKLIFSADPASLPTGFGEPWDEILSFAPLPADRVGDDDNNQDWQSDNYFDNGSNDDADHVGEFGDRLEIYLDPDDATDPWPKDQYEIRIEKGYTISSAEITTTFAGDSRYHSTVGAGLGETVKTLEGTQNNTADTSRKVSTTIWTRIASVWNEAPVTAPNIAYIELRGEAVQINSLTSLARGYTDVFNGADWNVEALSKDPSAWYRRVLTDKYHARPLPESLLDDVSLQAWSVDNAAKGYEFNAVIEGGTTVEDMLRSTTIAGFAKTLRSDKWGVWIDEDLTNVVPTMVLQPANTSEFQVEKELDVLPDALRVSFRDRENGYRQDEVLIDNTGAVVDGGTVVEAVELVGKVTLAEARIWGRRLLLERQERTALYGLTVSIRGFQAKRGDLIGASHDVLDKTFSFGEVEEVFEDGAGNATGLRLLGPLRLSEAATEDIFAVEDFFDAADIFNVSQSWGVAIELTDGTVRIEPIDEITDSDIVTFTTPFTKPASLKEGAWVGSGPLGTETRRFIIADIQPGDEDTARLVLIDEAPSIH